MNNEELKPPIENEPANKPQEENVSLAQFTELSDSLQALGQDVAEMRKSIKRSSVAMERHRTRRSRNPIAFATTCDQGVSIGEAETLALHVQQSLCALDDDLGCFGVISGIKTNRKNSFGDFES